MKGGKDLMASDEKVDTNKKERVKVKGFGV